MRRVVGARPLLQPHPDRVHRPGEPPLFARHVPGSTACSCARSRTGMVRCAPFFAMRATLGLGFGRLQPGAGCRGLRIVTPRRGGRSALRTRTGRRSASSSPREPSSPRSRTWWPRELALRFGSDTTGVGAPRGGAHRRSRTACDTARVSDPARPNADHAERLAFAIPPLDEPPRTGSRPSSWTPRIATIARC